MTHRALAVWISLALAPGLALAAPQPADPPQTSGAPAPGAPRPRLGFFTDSRPAQARAEADFLRVPTPARARAWLRALTEEPHVAGTPQDLRSAEYVQARLREFGLQAELNIYEVLLNYPKSVSLRLLAPQEIDLTLREEGHPRDKDSYSRDVFPAFHGYGASGTAQGQVIYVNYGRREDFERLETMGLSCEGRIVLVRYGEIFRGLKVKEAQDRGALAVIIYSDPADDGYMKGDIYPDGPMRPPSAIQRGSVQFLSHGPGDPSTPGHASIRGARRVARDKLDGIPKIPSLPLSWGEAEKILRGLAGERVPDDWQGGLPFAYHVGPGPAEARMAVEMDYAVRPIWNVIATIPGTAEKDRLVVLGNHRDAWTYGAVDPNSGTASFLETARGLGAALSAGWKPRRTIVLASWDAEEYGLVGSTEWVEEKLASLGRNAVAYINLDSSVTGPDLDVDGIPSLKDLVVEAAGDLAEPRAGGTLLDAWRARRHAAWAKEEPPVAAEAQFDLQLNPLGSGSDYTAFIDHAGVASVSFSFEGRYGVYHSIYDDLFWMEKFGDPEFLYHAAAARLYGLLAMRLASADVVPLRYAAYGHALGRELDLLRRRTIRDRRIWEAASGAAGTPPGGAEGATEARKKKPLLPDLAPIDHAIQSLAGRAGQLDEALARLESRGAPAGAEALARINDALVGIERAFLDPAGLPGRPWFRHTLYAPGLTTGYASWPFPGVMQALQDRDGEALDAAMATLVARLAAASQKIDAARALAEGM